MMDTFPKDLHEFVALAQHNGTRAVLQVAEFMPVVEGMIIGVEPGTNKLLGARVLFQPPCKPAWVAANGECSVGDYDQNRKNQLPLTATFYLIDAEDFGTFESVTMFSNPTQ